MNEENAVTGRLYGVNKEEIKEYIQKHGGRE